MRRAALLFLLSTSTLAGCATIDAVKDGPVEVFPVAADAPAAWVSAGVDGSEPIGDWLSQFNDDTMMMLVAESLEANPTLAAREASVRATKATARAVRGRRAPRVSASTSLSEVSNDTQDIPGRGDRSYDAIFGFGLDASWEADLWGRLSAGVKAAEADLAASEADLAATQLSIGAQTAVSWVDLNRALAQERVAVLTYEARERTKMLTERRFERGLATALDVRLARSALAGSEAAIAARRQASGNASRRLEILVGRYPSAELDAPAEIPSLPPIAAGGNPVMLLSRRPDVAAAEARVIAAGLRAEQARLALLPSLNLTASLDTNNNDLEEFIDPTRIAARAVAALAQPLFTGGALTAEREAALARAEATVAQYADTALTAWREVEDAIAADSLLAQQEEAQSRALEEAKYAEELAERQYTNGLVSIFNLIDAQTRRLTAEANLITARADRASNRIRYHLALGGGITAEPAAPDAVSLGGSTTP